MRKALTLAKTSRKSSRVTVLRLPEYTHEVWSRKNKNLNYRNVHGQLFQLQNYQNTAILDSY